MNEHTFDLNHYLFMTSFLLNENRLPVILRKLSISTKKLKMVNLKTVLSMKMVILICFNLIMAIYRKALMSKRILLILKVTSIKTSLKL